jgi:hypothetical protein
VDLYKVLYLAPSLSKTYCERTLGLESRNISVSGNGRLMTGEQKPESVPHSSPFGREHTKEAGNRNFRELLSA